MSRTDSVKIVEYKRIFKVCELSQKNLLGVVL